MLLSHSEPFPISQTSVTNVAPNYKYNPKTSVAPVKFPSKGLEPTGSQQVKIDKQRQHAESRWNASAIKTIGPFNQVSRQNIEVDKAFGDNVFEVLSNFFRAYSIEVEYSDNPTATAYCLACLDDLKFRMHIWYSRKDNCKLLIEIDLVCGDRILLNSKYATLAMEAISNACSSVRPSTTVEDSIFVDPLSRGTTDQELMQLGSTAALLHHCRQAIQGKGDDKFFGPSPIDSALGRIKDMLVSGRYDLIWNAVNMLIHLTDPYTSGIETTRVVSDVILARNGEECRLKHGLTKTWSEVQEKVLSLAVAGYSFGSAMNKDHFAPLSFLAMAVIAQAVNHAGQMEIAAFVDTCNSLLSDLNVVDVLLEKVGDAALFPHAAYLAVHVLAAFCLHRVQDVVSKIKSAVYLIHEAHRIGSIHHSALEQASGRLLHVMHA